MLGRRRGWEAGRRRRKSKWPALKSGPAEGRKRDLSRVPPAPRVWATSGHCTGPSGGSLPGVSLKGGSRGLAQPLSGWSPQTAFLCLGTDTWTAAPGALWAQPGAVPCWGTHQPTWCSPKALQGPGPAKLAARATGGVGNHKEIRVWLHRGRKNLDLDWVGGAHPTVGQEINPGSQMLLSSKFQRIPIDVSSSPTKLRCRWGPAVSQRSEAGWGLP